MKFGKWVFLALLLMAQTAAYGAAKALVYIDPREYEHEVKLWHFYYDYWVNQGEAIQPVALHELAPLFSEVALCEGDKTGDLLVGITPDIFYNPHMTVYHGKVEARVYSGSGRLLGQYEGRAQRVGFLDVVTAQRVQEVYAQAMQETVRRMQQDAKLQAILSDGLPESETPLACGLIPILPPVK